MLLLLLLSSSSLSSLVVGKEKHRAGERTRLAENFVVEFNLDANLDANPGDNAILNHPFSDLRSCAFVFVFCSLLFDCHFF